MIQEEKKQAILIIDDEPANLKLLNELLQDTYKVMAAKDGHKGIAIARSNHPPDLILLDILMPGITGYEVLEILRNDEDTKNIPVIFVTARVTEEEETTGLEMGAVDYISKPFNPVIVKARVKSHLELKHHRDFLEWMLKERNKELQQMEKEYSRLYTRL